MPISMEVVPAFREAFSSDVRVPEVLAALASTVCPSVLPHLVSKINLTAVTLSEGGEIEKEQLANVIVR